MRGHVHRVAVDVILFDEGLTAVQADPDLQLELGVLLALRFELMLHRDGGADRVVRVREGDHQ